MTKKHQIASGLVTFEAGVGSIEDPRWPFSEELSVSGVMAKSATDKMLRLQDLGWPLAKSEMKYEGKLLIVRKKESIWLLKCKPSCWRLYFYVREDLTPKRIIYVLAICKKTRKEDPAHERAAKRRASRTSCVAPFTFPDD